MSLAIIFFLSAIFSFMGSAPPGILNMYAFQLGLQKKKTAAIRFVIAVGITEYFFAWIAIRCAQWTASMPVVIQYFHYIAVAVLTVMGVVMLVTASRPYMMAERKNGFRKGLLLSLLNPMVIPFWIGISTYMQLHGWLKAQEIIDVFVFALGAALGVVALQLVYVHLSTRMTGQHWYDRIKYVPGILLLCLAAYSGIKLFAISN